MHDREKLTNLFDAALNEVATLPVTRDAAPTAQPVYPAYASNEERNLLHQEYARQQQAAYEQQQAYAAWQAREQQRLLAQRQAYAHQQALAQQEAYARQQALAQQQAYDQQQQQAHARWVEQEQRRYLAEQEAAALQQAHARQQAHAPEPAYETAPATAWAPVGRDETPAFGSAAPEIDVPESASGFVFMRPGEKSVSPADPHPEMNSSEEFAEIMEAKMAKSRRKQGRSFLFTMILFLGPTLGGAGWFVSDTSRVDAFRAAVEEVRASGDIKAILAKYQKSLDKVAVRGQHIDEATSLMGVDPRSEDKNEDPGMDKEMREMSGGEGGPTVADRNAKLRQKFGDAHQAGKLTLGGGQSGTK